ncbi:MAG: pilus assembly protein [Halothiobacillaceae bacterium]
MRKQSCVWPQIIRPVLHQARRAAFLAAAALTGMASAQASVDISDVPLSVRGEDVPPMNMLVMGRDHTLYYAAYNDASDLTGDGVLNVGYQPDQLDYFGYFDSYKCYDYDDGRFVPKSKTSDKTCNNAWSGDFLNYVTTARIDALRKVLYGGKRGTDTESLTVLERSYIPQDAHSWGKEYQGIERDGYDIRNYTPLELPTAGRYHLFANTSLLGSQDKPRLRVLTDSKFRVWEWVAIERPVAGNRCMHGGNGPWCTEGGAKRTDYLVRVEVCKDGLLEENCREYPNGNFKPTGLLQDYGVNERMLFGLISGSYKKNISGGVLRKPVGSINDEIDSATGVFLSDADGIINTIDQFQIVDFRNNYQYEGGWLTTKPMEQGKFPDWGNPVSEMMYESLRYFSGKKNPTPDFLVPVNNNDKEHVTVRKGDDLYLPVADWDDPYEDRLWCTPSAQLVISDVNTSYDTDSIPGSHFSSFTGDIPGLEAGSEADQIWTREYGDTRKMYIGESGNQEDGNPTPKWVTGLSDIRGLSPAEPTKLGGFYSAGIAKYAYETDIRDDVQGSQNIETFSVALASPLPEFDIPVGDGRVTLVPFAKSVGGYSIKSGKGQFQPTNTIVSFFVQEFANTDPKGADADPSVNGGRPFIRLRINFEDVEQGADHDMDAIANYELRVTADGHLNVQVRSEYAAGSIEQHMGYVISGTKEDGMYLVVRDCDTGNKNGNGVPENVGIDPSVCRGNNPSKVTDYYLDTPPGIAPGGCDQGNPPAACKEDLPLYSDRTFTPDPDVEAAGLLKTPLWYAAKYGSSGNEDLDPGEPSPNFFLVTNAGTLQAQLENAFEAILMLGETAATSAAVSSGGLRTGTLAYSAGFRPDDWSGKLQAFALETDGSVGEMVWDAETRLAETPSPSRKLYTTKRKELGTGAVEGQGVLLDYDALDPQQKEALDRFSQGDSDGLGEERLAWIRGDDAAHDTFRSREVGGASRLLGDIVNADPYFMDKRDFGYAQLEGEEGEAYRSFRMSDAYSERPDVIFVAANDGLLHAFNASDDAVNGGKELFGYMPGELLMPENGVSGAPAAVNQLMNQDYTEDNHRYFNDGTPTVGDAYIDGEWKSVLVGSMGAGGRTVFALDVTNPESFDAGNVLWEFTDPDLGYGVSAAQIGRLADGEWVAIFGNGYNSANHEAVLFVVRLSDGTLIHKIETGIGESSTPNGLATPVLSDWSDYDLSTRIAYAGDLLGNVWKFTFDEKGSGGKGKNSGKVTTTRLFQARDPLGNPQPITSQLLATLDPTDSRRMMLLFGTGSFFRNQDSTGTDYQTQTLYGILDLDEEIGGREDLLRQEITWTQDGYESTTEHDYPEGSGKGWYLDLVTVDGEAEGERVISRPAVIPGANRDRVIFTSMVPDEDPCVGGVLGRYTDLMIGNGARSATSVFDINQDGDINDDDRIDDMVVNRLKGLDSAGEYATMVMDEAGDVFILPGALEENRELEQVENTGMSTGRQNWRQLR